MDKDLRSSLIVTLVFFIGAAVQFIRGKTVFAVVGLVLGVVFVTLTLIGYRKSHKDGEGGRPEE